MKRFIIEMLGGVPYEDYSSLDEASHRIVNETHRTHDEFVNLLTSEHDKAMRQASAQLMQTQEMLRKSEETVARVEEERANASAGWTRETGAHRELYDRFLAVSIELCGIREACGRIEDERGAAEAERDTLKAKLSRPKKPKAV